MNLKQFRQIRKQLVERFGMETNAPTTEIIKRLIDEERLFADYPQDIRGARSFVELYEFRRKFGRPVKPIPEGMTRKDVGL